jgi:hypothetical protein
MINEIRSRQNPENIWWPWITSIGIAFLTILINPYLAIALGLTFPFLNLLRMEKADKVVLFSVLSVLYIIFWRFTNYPDAYYQFWEDWELSLVGGQMALTLLILGTFAAINWRDVRKFVARGEQSIKISNLTGVFIAGSLLGVYLIVSAGLDLVSQKVGYCKFPTMYDLTAQHQEATKHGLGGLLARRKDVGCGLTWKQGRDDAPIFNFSADRTVYYGWDDDNQLYYIEQVVTEKDNYSPLTTGALSYLEGNVIDVALMKIPQASFYESKCIGEEVIKECKIIVGFDHVVYGLDVRSVIFSDPDHFETTVNTILESAVGRIVEYENSLP